MKHLTQTITLMLLVSISFVGCKKSKYEFVNNEQPEEIAPPSPFDGNGGPETPANEFYGERGFWIKGNPGQVNLGAAVRFTGNCGANNSGTLTWQMGDGRSGNGSDFPHTYQSTGTFAVEATCVEVDGQTQKGLITIVVLPAVNNGGGGGNPGQNPSQSSPCRRVYNPCG